MVEEFQHYHLVIDHGSSSQRLNQTLEVEVIGAQPRAGMGAGEAPLQVPPLSFHSVHPWDVRDSGVKTMNLVYVSHALARYRREIAVAVILNETVTVETRSPRGRETQSEQLFGEHDVSQRGLAGQRKVQG